MYTIPVFEMSFETNQSESHLDIQTMDFFLINLIVILSDRFSNQSDRSNFSQSMSDGLALFRTLTILKYSN